MGGVRDFPLRGLSCMDVGAYIELPMSASCEFALVWEAFVCIPRFVCGPVG